MKRPAHDPLSSALGRLLAERRGGHLAEIRAEVIVPIPMFWRRRLGRGKNSPEVLAGCLGRSLGVPVRRERLGPVPQHVAASQLSAVAAIRERAGGVPGPPARRRPRRPRPAGR